MVSPYRFQVDQRVVIRRRGGGSHRQPSESSKGALGVIAPQMTDDWSDTKIALEPGIPNVYYVTLDSGVNGTRRRGLAGACSGGCAAAARSSILFSQSMKEV